MIVLQSNHHIHVRERQKSVNFHKDEKPEDFRTVDTLLNLKQHDKVHNKLLEATNSKGKVRRCRVVLSEQEKLENKLYLMSVSEIKAFIARVYNKQIKTDPKDKLGVVKKAIKIIRGK